MVFLQSLLISLLGFVLAGLSGCGSSSDSTDVNLHIMTEDYYPYNYREDGVQKGSTYEVVEEILRRTECVQTIENRDWASAIALLESEENAVLFTTTLTSERKDKFKWVGPVGRIDWSLFSLDAAQPPLASLGAANSFTVGVVQDYPMHELLVQAAHPELRVFATLDEAISAFFNRRVDLLAATTDNLAFYASQHGSPSLPFKTVFDIKTDLLYIAFSKEVSDSTIREWQDTLDQMKADGNFSEIYNRYLPQSRAPEQLQLYTEQYPPITFQDETGRITGGATELVRALLPQLGVPDNITITNWNNAYNIALLNPNIVLFTTERTVQREDLFNWVGPVGRNSSHFYTRAGSDVEVLSIEQAKTLRSIGTCSSWFTEQTLRDLGFTNLISVSEPERLPRMLMNGEIEATVFTDITMPEIVRSAGYELSDFSMQQLLTSTDFYIALSKGTDSGVVSAWQTALDKLVADGTFAAIYGTWYPTAENPYTAR